MLTLRSIFPNGQARDEIKFKYGAVEGARQQMDKLAGYLSGLPAAG